VFFSFSFLMVAHAAGIPGLPVDVGNHNSYHGGSGGSHSLGGSGGSHSSSGGGFFFFGGGGGTGSALDIVIAIIIVAIIVAINIKKAKNKGGSDGGDDYGSPMTDFVSQETESDILKEVLAHDPNFSKEKFISWSKEVFISLQKAWTKKDWRIIRPFESESLFRLHSEQLQEYIDNKQTNHIENICVNAAQLYNHSTDNQYEYLSVYMDVRLIDYVKDDATNQVLRGSTSEPYYMHYELTFMRSLSCLTNEANGCKSTTNCPNCGAPTDITSAGECAYCHSVITTGEHDWVLNQLDHVDL
ncbi:MAG: Tim44-like domain-containing protein, partial [Bacillota bacterium]|nr:Tim44-like domain-containing protein [Bacillota bacterium]